MVKRVRDKKLRCHKNKKTAGLAKFRQVLLFFCLIYFFLFYNSAYCTAVLGVNLLSVDFHVTPYLVVISLS